MENKKSLVILGGGSSIRKLIELGLWDKLQKNNKVDVWALNSSFLFMPFMPKRILWVDMSFFKQFVKDLQSYSLQGVELVCKNHPLYSSEIYKSIKTYPTVNDIKNLTDDKIFCGQGGFAGLFALSIAIKEGYNDINLMGYDFNAGKDGKTHWYQDEFKKRGFQSSGVGVPTVYVQNGKPLDKLKNFDYYTQFLDKVKINNISSISLIPYFPIISEEKFLENV